MYGSLWLRNVWYIFRSCNVNMSCIFGNLRFLKKNSEPTIWTDGRHIYQHILCTHWKGIPLQLAVYFSSGKLEGLSEKNSPLSISASRITSYPDSTTMWPPTPTRRCIISPYVFASSVKVRYNCWLFTNTSALPIIGHGLGPGGHLTGPLGVCLYSNHNPSRKTVRNTNRVDDIESSHCTNSVMLYDGAVDIRM